MTLDLHLRASELDPTALSRALKQLATPSDSSEVEVDDVRMIRFRPTPHLEGETQPGPAIYEQLEQIGILAAANSAGLGAGILQGASESCVRLLTKQRSWVVSKSINSEDAKLRESLGRLRREAHFCELLWAIGCRAFPQVFKKQELTHGFRYEMEFIPRYTLADRLIQGRETADSLCARVDEAIYALQDELYSHTTSTRQRSYIQVVESRFGSLVSGASFYRKVWHGGAVLNGERLAGVLHLLRLLESGKEFQSIVRPAGLQYCHGDLILDSILPPVVRGDRFRFIDPNPANSWIGSDIGKLLMNCITRYDLALRGDVIARIEGSDQDEIVATIHQSQFAEAVVAKYDQLALHLLEQAPSLSPELSPPAAIALAGLQAIAIAPFHELHHREPARARSFVLLGMRAIDRALSS